MKSGRTFNSPLSCQDTKCHEMDPKLTPSSCMLRAWGLTSQIAHACLTAGILTLSKPPWLQTKWHLSFPVSLLVFLAFSFILFLHIPPTRFSGEVRWLRHPLLFLPVFSACELALVEAAFPLRDWQEVLYLTRWIRSLPQSLPPFFSFFLHLHLSTSLLFLMAVALSPSLSFLSPYNLSSFLFFSPLSIISPVLFCILTFPAGLMHTNWPPPSQ